MPFIQIKTRIKSTNYTILVLATRFVQQQVCADVVTSHAVHAQFLQNIPVLILLRCIAQNAAHVTNQ